MTLTRGEYYYCAMSLCLDVHVSEHLLSSPTSPPHQKSIPPLASFNSHLRTHPFRLLPLSPDATSSIFHEVDAATWYTVSTRDFGKLGAGLGESALSWQFGRHLLDKYPVSCGVVPIFKYLSTWWC